MEPVAKKVARLKKDLQLITHAMEYLRNISIPTRNDKTFLDDINEANKHMADIEDNLIGLLNDISADWNK